MHADRINRIALTVFGLLLVLAGAAALTASLGGFGAGSAHHTLLANNVSTYIGQHGSWVWAVVAVACLLIALAALLWIAVLLTSTDRAGDLSIPAPGEHGSTALKPAAITGALTSEIEAYHGVETAKGRVIGEPTDPRIVVTVTAKPTADLAALHRRIEAQAVAHARQALGRTDLPVRLDLDLIR